VSVAEAAEEIGGRLRFETRLPGLAGWGRVLDWRRGQLQRLANVNVYRGNRLTADDILELGNTHVVIATGARWATLLYSALEIPTGHLEGPGVFTPDDIASGARIEGPVVVYDFDNYYMGSVLAEHLARGGHSVSYVTPAGHAAAWTIMSNEQPQVHRALFAAEIALHTLSRVTDFAGGEVTLASQFTNAETRLPCKSLVIVGARFANDALYAELTARADDLKSAGVRSVTRIGDALAPGAIVHAVYSGHRHARELDADPATLAHRRDAPLERRAAPPGNSAAPPDSGAPPLERPAAPLETLA
jgi:dimethylamine/trimethylamine dehydrogenase